MSNIINSILCIFPVVGDTKDAKRVELLKKAGFSVSVAAFNRNYFVSRLPNCEINVLATIENGHYLKRILIMIFKLSKLRKHLKKFSLVYAHSPDLAIFSYIASLGFNIPIIMDVADIRKIQVDSGIIGYLFRKIDKFIAERCSLIVVTAETFIKGYYEGKLRARIKNYLLIENKVDYPLELLGKINKVHYQSSSKHAKLRIGYFGVLRSNWTVSVLIDLLKQHKNDYEIYLAGINMVSAYDIEQLSVDYKNFTYLGPYKSPNDLVTLYEKIDVVIDCYPEPANDDDWFWAQKICRSNRFYEACFFKKAIITFSFCEDGQKVKNYNIGITLDSHDVSHAAKSIAEISGDDLITWQYNLDKLSEDVYMFRNEPDHLRDKINQILLHKV
jgi:hypothetical protein